MESLQNYTKKVERIFKSELEQFKVKSEKTLSDSHIVYQEQIQSLKEACRTKDIMISKLLETIENLNSNKKYNHCNTTTTNNGYDNDSEIQRSKNTHPAPPQWYILSTTSDTTATSDNGRSIHVITRILIEEQLREVRLQKGVQFKEYQRLHSETKKLEEKPDTYPPNTCVLMGDSILNGVKYAPMKKKYLRANHATFMIKEVRKAIMMRSKLRNKFLQDKNEKSRNDYRKQRNLCVALVRRAKQQYFSSLDLNLIADNK